MIRPPPRSTLPAPIFPSTTSFRSLQVEEQRRAAGDHAHAIGALRGKELLADLHAADGAGQQLGKPRGLLDVRRVEADEDALVRRSEEHTTELQSLMRISYAVFCLQKTR